MKVQNKDWSIETKRESRRILTHFFISQVFVKGYLQVTGYSRTRQSFPLGYDKRSYVSTILTPEVRSLGFLCVCVWLQEEFAVVNMEWSS